MPALAIVLVLLTTIADAAAPVLQHEAAQRTRARLHRPGMLRDVARHPAWLLGRAARRCSRPPVRPLPTVRDAGRGPRSGAPVNPG